MRKSLACIFCLLFSICAFSQDFSNKGKDFYLCFPQHVPANMGAGLAVLSIYITSDKASSGTITMANAAFSSTFSIAPNGLQEIQIPWDANIHISNAESNTVIKKSIRIKTNPGMPAVVAYAQQWAGARSAATLLLPVNVLGKKYYAVSFTQFGSNNGTFQARSQFQVIATKDNTVISITPRKNGMLGSAFTITLPLAGDMYQYQSTDGDASTQDLTGTLIESVASGSGGCLPIAVFSGSSNVTFGIAGCSIGASYDPLFQQLYPASTWGKNFGFVPFEGYPNGNPYRVMATENNTRVFFNGVPVATLNAGEIFPSTFTSTPDVLSEPTNITSDKPICVAQYVQRNACSGRGNSQGDPDMIILNPIEQNISDITIFSSTRQAITEQWVNVILKTSAIASFRINNSVPSGPTSVWQPMATLPGYSYLRYSLIGVPSARILADSGFNAIAYGWGANESYGYSAGTNVRDLYQRVAVTSEYSIEPSPSVCTGSPFKFKISLPYLVDSIRWNFSSLPGTPANVVRTYSNPPSAADADSLTVVNGKTIYWYSVPGFYNFTSIGIFPVTITTYAPNAEGCGNEQQIDFDLEITNPPVAAFNWAHNGCINQVVQFNDQTSTVKPTYRWWWNFGDPASGADNTSFLRNPSHTFSAPGTYTVRFSTVTTPGCLSDTITRLVVINPLPAANISGDIIVCNNAQPPAVIFTGTVGTAPFTFKYNINNGLTQTAVTTSGNSINVPVATNTVGIYIYHLVSVTDAAGTAGCFQVQADTVVIKVNPLPTASVSGNNVVCQNSTTPFITFTAAGGSVAPFTFTYTINGGANQTASTTTGNSVMVGVPTNIAGTFTYTLLSVRDASTTACSQLQSGSATVVVSPLPTATISGSKEVCQNTIAPLVTFAGALGTAPYIFTYTLNSGSPRIITSTGNIASLTIPTATAGSFIYQLISVRDASPASCIQLQNGTASVIVNPLPTSNFNINGAGCVSRIILFQDISVSNAGAISTWSWNFGDPASGAANTSILPNPSHIFNASGNYSVTLIVTNNKGCVSTIFSRNILINPLPGAGFILPEVCLLDPFAQFTDTSSVAPPQNISGWLWNFGDPSSGPLNMSAIKNAKHIYSAVGNYNVNLIVSTTNGCTDTLTQVLTVNGGNPIAAFLQLNSASYCSVDSVSIQNKSTIGSGNITKVEIYWDNTAQPSVFDSDDFPSFNKLYKHKYPGAATTLNYTVRFRAFSGGVCVNDLLQSITVLATPVVRISPMPNQCFINTPLLLNFGSQSAGIPGTGTYSGPGVVFSGTWNFIPSLAGIGTHSIQYKFSATAGGCADSISTTIVVFDTASAKFTVTGPLCEKNTIAFNNLSPVPAGITLLNSVWDFGDGSGQQTYLQGAAVKHIYPSASGYTVRMYNSTTSGCISTAYTQVISVKPIPVANFNFPDTLCLPAASVIFNNLTSISDGTENALMYQWNFGDAASGVNNISTGLNPTHIYNGSSPYAVTLKVISGAGCIHDTIKIINTIHPQPKAAFTISRPAGICIGDDVSFTDLSNGADGSVGKWQWNFNDGNLSTQQNPGHLYSKVGDYNVRLFIVNSFGCNSDTVSKPFTVNPYPLVNAGVDRFVLEGGSIVLQPVVTAINPQYLWVPSTYLDNNTLANPTTSPLNDITYKVTVTGRGGCSASDSLFVKLLLGPKIPNTFSPNGDGINEKWTIEYLESYPNNRVQVFTRAGQLVFESRGYKTPWNGTMNGKTLPIDTYYYLIEPGNGRKPITGFITLLK